MMYDMGAEIRQAVFDANLQAVMTKRAKRYQGLVDSLRAPYETHDFRMTSEGMICIKCLQDKLQWALKTGCFPGRRAVDLDEYNLLCCVDAHVYKAEQILSALDYDIKIVKRK